LSDFIQEDREIDFRRDGRLSSQAAARGFAAQTAKANSIGFQGVLVFLGQIRSAEYSNMEKARRGAIQAFWEQYFIDSGNKPRFVADGSGLLLVF